MRAHGAVQILSLAGCLLLSTCGGPVEQAVPLSGFCEPNEAPFPVRPQPAEPATLPPLHVAGTAVVDADGQAVALRGVNFGSWLMMETWIAGIGALDEGELLVALDAKAQELGVADLLAEAKASNQLAWLTEGKSHWACVQEWRAFCQERAAADQREAAEALWSWFDDQPWIFEEQSLWAYLAGRFGWKRAELLRAAFADHYITEQDVERLADLGLNLIRLPVWFEALETDQLGANRFKEEGWQRLDRIATWARRHGVYLMIDLHGAPGGQSTSWHQGLADGGRLWTEERCIQKTERLWRALASYFAGDPHVAVYDLLNEPMNAPDRDTFAAVHDRLRDAVRAEDPDTIVMLEDGYRAPSQLVSPAELDWQNAMFSIHLYPGGASADEYVQAVEAALIELGQGYDRFGVPLFLGEFNPADGIGSSAWAPEALDRVLGLLDERGVHWAPWTWKYCDPDSAWGLYRPRGARVRIDVQGLEFAEIFNQFEQLDSGGYEAQPGYEAAFRAAAGRPFGALDLVP